MGENQQPPHGDIDASGLLAVRSDVVCTITRLRFRSIWGALWAKRAYRKLAGITSGMANPITSSFCFEGPRTCIVLSLWTSDAAVGAFNLVVEKHVDIARMTLPRLAREEGGRAEVFTALFGLRSVSQTNRAWKALGNFDDLVHV